MKKNLLYSMLLAMVMPFLGTGRALADSFVYENDFSSTEGLTIVGSGSFVDDERFGKVFQNVGGLVRTNYLLLPDNLLAQSSETKALTIGFWVTAEGYTPDQYIFAPFFTAYAQKNETNSWPMLALQSRGLAQVNCAGWCDFTYADNAAGKNTVYNSNSWEVTDGNNIDGGNWLEDQKWHYYTAVFTETSLKIYLDGTLKNEWTVDGSDGHCISGLFSNGSELKYICLGGNQAWDWNDADGSFSFANFYLTNEALTPEQIAAQMDASKGKLELKFPTSELLQKFLTIEGKVGAKVDKEKVFAHLNQFKDDILSIDIADLLGFISELSAYISHMREKHTSLVSLLGLFSIETEGIDLSMFNLDLENKTIEFLKEGSGSISVKFLGDEVYKSFSFTINLKVNAHTPEVVDITVSPESGDIAEAVAAEVKRVTYDGDYVGNITVNLTEGAAYTIGSTITGPGSIIINGNGATVDASSLSTPLITLNGGTTFALKSDGTPSDHFLVDNVTIKDVTITGQQGALLRDAQKSLVETVTIENSVIEMPAAGKNVLDFNGKGYAGKVIVKNSTIWSAGKNTGFFAQYGSRPKNVNGDLLQEFDFENSTIVNIANGKNFNDLKQNGTAQNVYTIKNNIFSDCGKSAQVVVGFNKGQNSATPVWDVDGNTFFWSGADVSEAETSKAGKKDGEDIVKNSLTSDPEFTDAANGDFTIGAATDQAELKTGDPRWLVPYAAGEGDATALLAEIEEAKKLLKYSMSYYDEHNAESPETEAKALVDAIRNAEEQVSSGSSQKKIDKTLEALKQAEIDYADALMEYELDESQEILAVADPEDELAAELLRLYDTQDIVRADYWNKPKNIKNYADELDKAQKAYLRNALNELLPKAQAFADNPEVSKAIAAANKALEGDSSEDLFDALTNLQSAVDKAILAITPLDGNVATFEDLTLDAESFWQGIYEEERDEDEIGLCYNTFQSGSFQFDNYYSPDWGGYWGNFAYSNQTSSSYESLADQFHAVTGGGRESATFGVAFPQGGAITYMDNDEGTVIPGFYITNSSYAYTSMLNGDAYAKKFAQGDWFKLTITGYDADDNPVGTKEFYLADFRDEDSSKHYIVNDWRFVDLIDLGKVKSVKFILDSSDKGTWGMNTPGYFCLDDFGANGIEQQPEGNIPSAINGVAVNESTADTPVYNLAGQRVNGKTVKGIVIKNGKKYILK